MHGGLDVRRLSLFAKLFAGKVLRAANFFACQIKYMYDSSGSTVPSMDARVM